MPSAACLSEWLAQEARVIDKAQWDLCGADLSLEDYRGRPCVAGLDLSITTDVTALVLVFTEAAGGYTVFPFFFIPAETRSEATKRFLALVTAGQLRHPRHHPCLTWMASNFTLRRDANHNMARDKGKATDRIDGCTALIMALSRAMLAPAEEPVSAYADGHGLFTV